MLLFFTPVGSSARVRGWPKPFPHRPSLFSQFPHFWYTQGALVCPMKTKLSHASIVARNSRSLRMNSSGSPNVDLQMNPNAAKPAAMHGKPNRAIRAVVVEVVVSLLVPVAVAAMAEAAAAFPPVPVRCSQRPARPVDSRRKSLSNHLEIVRFIAGIVSKRKRAADKRPLFPSAALFGRLVAV